ncbi:MULTISPECIES: molybdate ABC transporter substrate-binding protein [unclassified Microbacterium]|uniref:molybdate ABC transporter substrate-binding protein n=1 Tax=unclassified Microbacterium TaxID=2609290 RepID=UPI00214BD8E4|nr:MULTISPECIES: molybdate ABC transporter substrate-binding protein [unclassified Microbacterium]MCR2783847.1 molybdate ABC transporter substrate-binding protein [Microbacterium sp. zg.B96]WIM15305.1 molybdate ABC transporter substrate-binding protein [Microbacterium sp. zg-B96]
MRARHAVAAALAAIALTGAGCAASATAPGTAAGPDEDPNAPAAPAADPGPELTGELSIAAAASLQAAFDDLATAFEARHPSLEVLPIAYDGSPTLATQIVEGAAVDVFAAADQATMQTVVDAGLATDPAAFATNTLALVVPPGNPGGVQDLADLADPDLIVVACAAAVPCGAASGALLDAAGVTASIDSHEQNVTAVLTKVATGEADAGLVYVTDAARAAVDTIPVAGAADIVNRYPIVALAESANPRAAAAFVAFVRSPDGQGVLAGLGFGAP